MYDYRKYAITPLKTGNVKIDNQLIYVLAYM